MRLVRFLFPRLQYILFMALFWSIAANGPRILNFDGDLPRHLLLGRLIRETGVVPLTDTFSFRTVGYPSIPHEWLSQVLLSLSNDLLGLSGVVVLAALLVTATWIVVYHEASRRTGHLFALLLVTALGVAASMIHVLPRPHLFTYLFAALWILALERIKATNRTPGGGCQFSWYCGSTCMACSSWESFCGASIWLAAWRKIPVEIGSLSQAQEIFCWVEA